MPEESSRQDDRALVLRGGNGSYHEDGYTKRKGGRSAMLSLLERPKRIRIRDQEERVLKELESE